MIDAVRISDGMKVVLKCVQTRRDEIAIGKYLSSELLLSDDRNHSVPILDVIILAEDDSEAIIVMPLLYLFAKLPFRRLGEVTEAFQQFLQVKKIYLCLQQILIAATGPRVYAFP